jgi:hypothetical protein
MNRREWLAACAASPGFGGGRGYVAGNEAVSLTLDPNRGRSFVNRLSRETMELPVEDFRLLFRGREEVSSKTMAVRAERNAPDRLVLLYTDREGLEARVEYHAPASKNYLRKQIALRRVKDEPLRLLRADLEDWSGVGRDWQSIRKDRLP